MAFDYKKEYKEFYMPEAKPQIIEVPKMNYIAVRGSGDPNDENGEYKKAIGLLYAIAFTIKMSKKGDHKIEGYFDYVVPPLEGFWWQDDVDGVDYTDKSTFNWISVIRLPDFVTKEMVASMNSDSILFAMANPVPEIMPDAAKEAGARVVGTGRSDFPNQVNNVVAFPGIFKGALEGRARQITEEMKLAAAYAIAGLVKEEDLCDDNILPEAFDPQVAHVVAEAVKSHI